MSDSELPPAPPVRLTSCNRGANERLLDSNQVDKPLPKGDCIAFKLNDIFIFNFRA